MTKLCKIVLEAFLSSPHFSLQMYSLNAVRSLASFHIGALVLMETGFCPCGQLCACVAHVLH